jgi:signal transduction histidine kinase
MTAPPRVWQARLLFFVTWAQWVALVIGIFAGVVNSGGSVASLAAAGTAGLYVLVANTIPVKYLEGRFVLEALSLAGAILTMVSITLTGAVESPYFLLSLTPAMQATVLGGFRTGIGTASLSAGLLLIVSIGQGEVPVTSIVGFSLLYMVVAATVAQGRRMLTEAFARTEELEAHSAASDERLGYLESAHTVLSRLAESAGTQPSVTDIGRLALEEIGARFPGAAGIAAITGDDGPVVVARTGNPESGPHRTSIPLTVADRQVGLVVVSTPEPVDVAGRKGMETTLRPVALAFANVMLLQEIAGTAIREERNRLARELHDEIGPSLASLGLALDTALVRNQDGSDLVRHLEQLRGNVGRLVEEVRTTVADLRTARSGSLSSQLARLSTELPPGPEIVVELDERRPPRPSLADQLASIVVEATRNAHRHSGATRIRVAGWTDFDRGRVVIEDDGSGFSPETVREGHFGLIGMRERAVNAGLDLVISSGQDGTRVAVAWGET